MKKIILIFILISAFFLIAGTKYTYTDRLPMKIEAPTDGQAVIWDASEQKAVFGDVAGGDTLSVVAITDTLDNVIFYLVPAGMYLQADMFAQFPIEFDFQGNAINFVDSTAADGDTLTFNLITANDNAAIVIKAIASGAGTIYADSIWVEIKDKVYTTDVSNPPTDAELDAAFGTPATVGSGWEAWIDDNGSGANFYYIKSDGTNWWILTATKAS